MNSLQLQTRRRQRIRATISGTPERPRLAVKITSRHITCQVIDDTQGRTFAYATTVHQKLTGTMTERAQAIGEQIAAACKTAKITKVVFDRGGRIYHGRLHALATAARNAGLDF